MKGASCILSGLVGVCFLLGCPPAGPSAGPDSIRPTRLLGPGDFPRIADASPHRNDDDLPPELNRARAAAQYVAMRRAVPDPGTAREIALHVMLYRAAYQTNVGDITRHYLLEPYPDDPLPPLTVDRREFHLRVLGGLSDLDVPIAWGSELNQNPVEKEIFPGTAFLATRLRIRIDERTEGGKVIKGEIGDWTVDVGSSRQGFTATWDGTTWSIKRARVRVVR